MKYKEMCTQWYRCEMKMTSLCCRISFEDLFSTQVIFFGTFLLGEYVNYCVIGKNVVGVFLLKSGWTIVSFYFSCSAKRQLAEADRNSAILSLPSKCTKGEKIMEENRTIIVHVVDCLLKIVEFYLWQIYRNGRVDRIYSDTVGRGGSASQNFCTAVSQWP